MLEAMKHPDQSLAPPPSAIVSSGRMNSHGISVFYGAKELETSISEVRPPVGSNVLTCAFEITRPLVLLNLSAIQTLQIDEGSIFDEHSAERVSQLEFLRFLADHLNKPVMPREKEVGYLPTQVLADYLSSLSNPHLDGIAYPSVQTPEAGPNIVLFHKSSRVAELDPGAAVESYDGFWAGGAFREHYRVDINQPAVPRTAPNREDRDTRTPALMAVRESLTINKIKGVKYAWVDTRVNVS